MIRLKNVVVAKKVNQNSVEEYTVNDLPLKYSNNSVTGMSIIQAMAATNKVEEQDNFFVYPFVHDVIAQVWARYKMNYTCYKLDGFENFDPYKSVHEFTKYFKMSQAIKMYEVPFKIIEETS
jgi:hypothetical protein